MKENPVISPPFWATEWPSPFLVLLFLTNRVSSLALSHSYFQSTLKNISTNFLGSRDTILPLIRRCFWIGFLSSLLSSLVSASVFPPPPFPHFGVNISLSPYLIFLSYMLYNELFCDLYADVFNKDGPQLFYYIGYSVLSASPLSHLFPSPVIDLLCSISMYFPFFHLLIIDFMPSKYSQLPRGSVCLHAWDRHGFLCQQRFAS